MPGCGCTMRSRIHCTRAWCTDSRRSSFSRSIGERVCGVESNATITAPEIAQPGMPAQTATRNPRRLLLCGRDFVKVDAVAGVCVGPVHALRLPSRDLERVGDDASPRF